MKGLDGRGRDCLEGEAHTHPSTHQQTLTSQHTPALTLTHTHTSVHTPQHTLAQTHMPLTMAMCVCVSGFIPPVSAANYPAGFCHFLSSYEPVAWSGLCHHIVSERERETERDTERETEIQRERET